MEAKTASDNLERLGGEAGVVRWMTRFYEMIAAHPLLAPLFTQDLHVSRDKQIDFMVEFLGGPAKYTQQYGKPFLRFKHRHVPIGREERDAWMELVMTSLSGITSDALLIDEIRSRLAPLANAMINHDSGKKDAYYFN